jgi:shikimate kinase
MNLKLKATPGIYLVGFMGSGKTTIGRLLAEEIGWRFADVDDDIEAQQRMSVGEIFEARGEEGFRRCEHEALAKRVRSIRSGMPMVLALGGGAFTRPENISLLSGNGISIWIDTAWPVVRRRVQLNSNRPLARDPKKFEELFHARREHYAKADFCLKVDQDNSRQAVIDLLKLPLFT